MQSSKGGSKFFIINTLVVVLISVIDRAFKQLVEQNHFATARIGWQYLAFERFHNRGIAFGLPLAPKIVIPLTFCVLVGLIIYARHKITAAHKFGALIFGAILLILFGAISNAFDRTVYGYTIDYLRIFNGIINIADLQVAAGIGGLIYFADKK